MSYIGIDIGGTTIKAGRVGSDGVVLESLRRPTEATDIAALLGNLSSLVATLSAESVVDGVGIGIPGLRSRTGLIEASPNVPCLVKQNLEALLRERIQLPIVGRNDADMNAWGEFKVGAATDVRYMACLTLGTGVGSGLILDGKLYGGSRGHAAEVGHMVVEPDGYTCPCGGRGCLETRASATGIVARARDRVRPHGELSADDLVKAAAEGNADARRVLEEAGQFLGIACANLINTLNLEMIVLGGGVANAGRWLFDPAIEEARRRSYAETFNACRIVPAKLGSDAGVIGAALYARDVVRRRQDVGRCP